MTAQLDGQVGLFDHDSWFGKMSPEHLAAAAPKDQTLPPSLRKSSKSVTRMPVCVCVYQTEDGQNPGVTTLRMEHGALLGEYTMHSFGEFPNEENESRLSQILEECAPRKYSLSAKACEGILRRAARRGKELPVELREALERQAVCDP